MKKVLLMLALLVGLSGCGPWVRAESHFESEQLNFSMDLPPQWMRANTNKLLSVTRDGFLLQGIVGNRIDLAQEKQFDVTKKRVTADMLPQEIAEVVVDDLQSNQKIAEAKVEENVPATLGGVPGFKIRFWIKKKDGMTYRCVYYGALSGGALYTVQYLAPSRHYFDKDLETFERTVKTFRLLKS